MDIPLQFRRGTATEWTDSDPILLEGEIGLVLVAQDNDPDTQPLFKIGNGASKWSELEWAQRGPRGWGFQFQWNGYELGVKREDQDTYQSVDLRGARGANLEYEWTGTTLAVKTSDDPSFPAGVGLGLQFQWDGYELGVKRDEDAEFQVVNLRGANFEYAWDGTRLGVKTSDETEFSYTGLGLQYVWDGYSLGVKRQEDAEHVFQELRGASLQFEWDGYSLGVKDSDQEDYEYVDLRGARGANFEYHWTGTVLAVKTSDDAEFPAGVDLKGEKGDPPAHTWAGTSLTFKNPDGSDGDTVDLKGETGDPGALAEGKIWVGNAEGVAEQQDVPEAVFPGLMSGLKLSISNTTDGIVSVSPGHAEVAGVAVVKDEEETFCVFMNEDVVAGDNVVPLRSSLEGFVFVGDVEYSFDMTSWFDNNESTSRNVDDNYYPARFIIGFAEPVAISFLRAMVSYSWGFENVSVYGSNSGAFDGEEDLLDSGFSLNQSGDAAYVEHCINNSTPYLFYQVILPGNNKNAMSTREFQLCLGLRIGSASTIYYTYLGSNGSFWADKTTPAYSSSKAGWYHQTKEGFRYLGRVCTDESAVVSSVVSWDGRELAEGKVWVGNAEGVAEETSLNFLVDAILLAHGLIS